MVKYIDSDTYEKRMKCLRDLREICAELGYNQTLIVSQTRRRSVFEQRIRVAQALYERDNNQENIAAVMNKHQTSIAYYLKTEEEREALRAAGRL